MVYKLPVYFNKDHQKTLMEDSKMKIILFLIGLLLLSGLYLYFVETWRIGCALLWLIIPAYCLAGWAIMEGK